MERIQSADEIREEIMNGVFGINLKAMGFICYQIQPDKDHPRVDPDVVHFDMTRRVELLSPAKVNKIIDDVTKLANSLGFHLTYTYTIQGKMGDFYKLSTSIKIGVKGY